MAYLGDIRENSIGPNGEIWEGDNRVEERYYYNGMYIDLCGLPVEDYCKTIFVTNGSGASEDVNKKTNSITVEVFSYINEEGMSVYAYRAMAKQPVSSDISIQMVIENEEGEREVLEMVVLKDTANSIIYPTKMSVSAIPPKVITSDYNPKKDDIFEYNTVLPENEPVLPMAYRITLPQNSIDTISEEELKTLLKNSGKISMKDETTSEEFSVVFETIPVDNLMNMSMSESQMIQREKSQDIIFVTDKNVKSIEEGGLGFNEIDKWTKKDNSINIDNVILTIWYKRVNDNSQTRICDSANPSFVVGGAKEDRKYIIYYE